MNKKLTFRWVSFIEDPGELAGWHALDKLVVGSIHTQVNLLQLSEVVSVTSKIKGAEVSLSDFYGRMFVNWLTTHVQLETHLDVGDDRDLYTVSCKGPAFQWLLEHSEEVNNPDPSKIHYLDSTVVQFLPKEHYEDRVEVRVLNLEDIRNFIHKIQGEHVSWLDGTFKEFLEKHGYMDTSVHEGLSYILIMYKAAKSLGFNDPEEIAKHFGNKRLLVDLRMKAVFKDLKDRP